MTSTEHPLSTAFERSRLGAAVGTSRAVAALRGVARAVRGARAEWAGTLRGWLDGSRARRAIAAASATAGAAAGTAAVTRGTRALGRWGRSSFLYRWLTAEPEPEVIVIDLRETVTVGPIIRLLDAAVESLGPAYRRSRARDALADAARSVRDAPVRALSAVVLVAAAVNLAATVAFGSASPVGLGVRVAALAVAALGTRVTRSWDELARTRPARLLIAALEPPEPVEADGSDPGRRSDPSDPD